MRINANVSTLTQVAAELERIANDIAQVRNQVRNAGNDTQSAWQSRFTGQFSQSVTTTQNRINACEQNVRTLVTTLRSTATAVR